MLYLVTKRPKHKYAAGLSTPNAVIEAETAAAALRKARAIDVFNVDYPGEFCATGATPISDGTNGYL